MIFNRRDWGNLKDIFLMIQIVIRPAGYHFICIIYSGQLWLKFCGMNVTEENKATETEKMIEEAKV